MISIILTTYNRAATLQRAKDTLYLQALKEADPPRYRQTIVRVWVARALRPVLR